MQHLHRLGSTPSPRCSDILSSIQLSAATNKESQVSLPEMDTDSTAPTLSRNFSKMPTKQPSSHQSERTKNLIRYKQILDDRVTIWNEGIAGIESSFDTVQQMLDKFDAKKRKAKSKCDFRRPGITKILMVNLNRVDTSKNKF